MMPARSGGTAKMICQNYLDGNWMKLASGLPKSEVYGDCISWMLPAEKATIKLLSSTDGSSYSLMMKEKVRQRSLDHLPDSGLVGSR
jgi:hypothetical protein